MELFPDIPTLASASLEQVIKAWEGLGYYSRVRNLHAAAREIVEIFGGEIPSDPKKLSQLKGIGPYTRGAILSFGFQKRAAAVDGNVTRVVARYHCIEKNVSRSAVKKEIEKRAEEMLDRKAPWITAEALIELGATVCGVRPRCEICPLKEGCAGLRAGKEEALPIKDQPKEITELHRTVLVVVSNNKILVKKGEAGKVMADLYEFPYVDKEKSLPWGLKKGLQLPRIVHTFTRYKAFLYPSVFHVDWEHAVTGYEWIEKEKMEHLPFSSGHKKILREI
jgi:A/G-specific adenine glycosylase